MAFAKIPLNFEVMNKAYRDHKILPGQIQDWLDDQNRREDEENQKRAEHNRNLKPGEKPQDMLHKSTSCCMQASLAFNATGQPIPHAGSTPDRNNTLLRDGRYYILAVGEFRSYLTYKYGPTDNLKDVGMDPIMGKTGVMILGGWHIEFWDGTSILQSTPGATKRKAAGIPVGAGGVMAAGIEKSGDRWFWLIGDQPSKMLNVAPDWLKGWWTVYDGNYYYYYFHTDGWVNYIETKPNPKWTPPKTVGNQGQYAVLEHGPHIVWRELGGQSSTEETFTRLNWTSETEMNGVSNKYSPLFARKIT